MIWYQYVLIILFFIMLVSPIWFFGKVEKFLFQQPDSEEVHQYVFFVNPEGILSHEEPVEQINRDAHILSNLNHMIKTSKKKEVKNMWKIKKLEFERKMRWESLLRR
jgi:hypothetical protein